MRSQPCFPPVLENCKARFPKGRLSFAPYTKRPSRGRKFYVIRLIEGSAAFAKFDLSLPCSLPHGTEWNRRPIEIADMKSWLTHTRNRLFAKFDVSFLCSLSHGTDCFVFRNFSFGYGTDCNRPWNPFLSRLLYIILS